MPHTVRVTDEVQAPVDAVLPGRVGLLVRIPIQPGLRAAALEAVRKIVEAEEGDPEEIEAVYFTSFVMQ